jgi:hypothetical protein
MNKQELLRQLSTETTLSTVEVDMVVSAALRKLSGVIRSQGLFRSPLIHLNPVEGANRGILRLPEIKPEG